MKYSLRSLMTFSIRDLALATVIVAVCVAWWLDHRRQAQVIERLTPTTIDFGFLNSDDPYFKLQEKLLKQQTELMAELERLKYERDALPNSSAPAPNPPKK